MRKSKYLILSPLFLEFNDDLTEIDKVKKSFDLQNVSDLLRFDNLSVIIYGLYELKKINFVYFPDNIEIIKKVVFNKSEIKYINFSNCGKLKHIGSGALSDIKIDIIDLSNCSSLHIKGYTFLKNSIIKRLILFGNTKKLIYGSISKCDIITLDLSKCRTINIIGSFAINQCKIKNLKLHKNLHTLETYSITDDVEYIDISNCKKLENIEPAAVNNLHNSLNRIKILNNIYIIEPFRPDTSNTWKTFVLYYNETGKRAGDYKLENNKWKWYPL